MKIFENKPIKYTCMTVMSLLTTIALATVSRYSITGIDILIPCVFALCMVVYSAATKHYNKADLKFILPLSLIAAIAADLGGLMNMEERTFAACGITDVICIILLLPFFAATLQLLFFSSDVCRIKSEAGVFSFKSLMTKMAVMLICWLPYYLTYYPGGVGNDVFEELNMCLGNIPWTNHHPVAYTALMDAFVHIFGGGEQAGLTRALGAMAFCQMLLLALTLSLLVQWLVHKGMTRVSSAVVTLAFALHPIVAMYSIYLTKDVIFACIIVLLVLYLYDFMGLEKPKTWHYAILTVLSLLTVALRNNGLMVVLLTFIALFIIRRKQFAYLYLSLLLILGMNALYKGPVFKALGIEKQSFVESASIPLSQVAYTIYTDGVIDEEDSVYLESIMPFDKVKEEFEPGYTDSYKFSESFDADIIDSDTGKFIKTWWHMLPDNFGRYVEAYLMQTSGYWCYGITNTVATEGVVDNELGVAGCDFLFRAWGVSLKPLLAELVLIARKLPILCFFSQMGIQILCVILLAIQYIRKNHAERLLILVPLFALWLSVMIATPAFCLFRYMCPVFFLWPLLIYEWLGTA